MVGRDFVTDVAREIERRRRRRKRLVAAAVIGAIVLAALYLRCGRGWGTGGDGGTGGGDTAGSAAPIAARDARPARCAVRVAARGYTVDRKPATLDQVVAACRAATGAEVIVTGDAREGDWRALRAALEAAKVELFVRDTGPAGESAGSDGPR